MKDSVETIKDQRSGLRYSKNTPADFLPDPEPETLSEAKRRRQELNKELYKQAKAHIQENISDPDYNLSDLGRTMYMSERQLQRLFDKNNSPGFRAELNNLRMREAARLISLDKKSITEIAEEVGFKGAMHFSKAFKRTYQHSPREWRKFCRQQKSSSDN